MTEWNQDAAEAAQYRRSESATRGPSGYGRRPRRTVSVVCVSKRGHETSQHVNPVRREVKARFAKVMRQHVAWGTTLSKSQRKNTLAIIRRGVVRELREGKLA